MEIVLQIFLLAAGFTMLIKGADFFVDGSSGIASRFGIPQLVVGLTIVAMGTSAPEAAVSISAALKGNAGITIGNVVGSNILNILIILGLTAFLTKKIVPVASSTIKYEMPFMVVITLILLWMGYAGNEIARLEGAGLWVVFLLYLFYLLKMAKKGADKNAEDDKGKPSVREGDQKEKNMAVLVLSTAIGLVLIVIGSSVTVDAATDCRKQYLQYPFCGRNICVDYTRSIREQIYSGFYCSCSSGSAAVDLLFQRKEPEPCGGRLAAAWIFGIFYLFTLNHNLCGNGVQHTG